MIVNYEIFITINDIFFSFGIAIKEIFLVET